MRTAAVDASAGPQRDVRCVSLEYSQVERRTKVAGGRVYPGTSTVVAADKRPAHSQADRCLQAEFEIHIGEARRPAVLVGCTFDHNFVHGNLRPTISASVLTAGTKTKLRRCGGHCHQRWS